MSRFICWVLHWSKLLSPSTKRETEPSRDCRSCLDFVCSLWRYFVPIVCRGVWAFLVFLFSFSFTFLPPPFCLAHEIILFSIVLLAGCLSVNGFIISFSYYSPLGFSLSYISGMSCLAVFFLVSSSSSLLAFNSLLPRCILHQSPYSSSSYFLFDSHSDFFF